MLTARDSTGIQPENYAGYMDLGRESKASNPELHTITSPESATQVKLTA